MKEKLTDTQSTEERDANQNLKKVANSNELDTKLGEEQEMEPPQKKKKSDNEKV